MYVNSRVIPANAITNKRSHESMIATPQPMAESSGRGTRRIRLLKRIHNNYIAIIFITFVIPY
ncbi:hypothetical protein Hanom_Chr06g00516181 [Helianthus anomalus]